MAKNNLTSLLETYAALVKIAYIRKLPNGKYRVYSEKGKNMGTYNSHAAAKKRLGQIEFFKHKKASDHTLDLSHLDDINYSALVRELRKLDKDAALQFITIYKQCFDKTLLQQLDTACALPMALMIFAQHHPLCLPQNDT